MFKTTIIHIALVLAPTVLYILYLVAARKVQMSRSDTAATLRRLPWPWLLGAGILLMAASLAALSLTSGESPRGTYVPPHLEDGEIVPARVE